MISIPATSGIYQIVCIPTGQVYIGSTKNLRRRWDHHKAELNRRYGRQHDNRGLQDAWDIYGAELFQFDILEHTPITQLITREQYWIEQTRCNEPEYGFNRRLQADSDRGLRRSPAFCEHMRQLGKKRGRPAHLFTPEAREAHRISQLARRGRSFSTTHREKLSEAKIGKKQTPERAAHFGSVIKRQFAALTPEERARRVAPKNINRNFLLTDPSGNEYHVANLTAFCLEHKLDRSSFTRMMQGKKASYRGWTCKRIQERLDEP